jgi:hypothetical protein
VCCGGGNGDDGGGDGGDGMMAGRRGGHPIFWMVDFIKRGFQQFKGSRGDRSCVYLCGPVQNTQSVGIFQYKILSRQGCSGTKYSVSRDIPVHNTR